MLTFLGITGEAPDAVLISTADTEQDVVEIVMCHWEYSREQGIFPDLSGNFLGEY